MDDAYSIVWLVKRKQGVTPQQFRDHCETRHRRLSEKALHGYASSYQRFHLSSMPTDGAEPIFDAVIRIGFTDRDAYQRCISAIRGNAETANAFADDVQNFVDHQTSQLFETEDSSSKLQVLPPSDNVLRTIWFARHRPGMSHAQCRTYYENKHRLIGEYVMNGYAYNYDRFFLHKLSPDGPEPYYTFIMNMNFPARASFEQLTANIINDPTLGRFIVEDEARFIDRDSAVHYEAELCTSTLA